MLPSLVGRTFAVGAAQASPALALSLSATGTVRLSLGAMLLVVGLTPCSNILLARIIAVYVANSCVLQPFAAACRSHARIPTFGWLTISLLEGLCLVTAFGADYEFNYDTLVDSLEFQAAAASLVFGLFVTSISASRALCCQGAAVSDSSGEAGLTPLSVPLFDENRHRLSPTAKRLLS